MYQRKLERVIEKGKPFANVRQRKSEKSREFQCFTLALAWFLSVKCQHLKTSNFLNNENNCNVKKRKKVPTLYIKVHKFAKNITI